MSDYETQYGAVYPYETPQKSGGMGWVWALLIFLVLVAAIVFLVLWLYERGKSKDEEGLNITGAEFTTPTQTTIQASWTSVGNDDDVVTLYVYPSGNPTLNFNPNGSPKSGGAAIVQRTSTSSPNTTRTLSVTVPENTKNVVYGAALVVTNSNSPNLSKVERGDGLSPGSEINKAFLIRKSGQSTGEIVYTLPTDTTVNTGTVEYNWTESTSIDNILFHHDPDGYICSVMPSQSGVIDVDSTTKCSDLGMAFALYDKESSTTDTVLVDDETTTSNGSLGIERVLVNGSVNPKLKENNSLWDWNQNTSRWCLKNIPTKCMNLQSSVKSTKKSDIDVVTASSATTKFSNINFSLSST